MASSNVVLYTHPDCTYSDALKEELDTAGTPYDEIDLSAPPRGVDRAGEAHRRRTYHPGHGGGRHGKRGLPRRWLKFLIGAVGPT